MKKIKKLLVLAMSMCMTIGLMTIPIHANETDPDDIMNYVIGGTGTEDDPYILSENNPYKEKFDAMAKEAVQPTIMPAVDFSGTLTGPVYYGQTNGGIWNYSGGGPSASIDNALTILCISYCNNDDTEVLSSIKNDASQLNLLVQELAKGLIGAGLTAALTPAFGPKIASTIGGIFVYAIGAGPAVDNQVINQALSKNVGILKISYRTSYHGSWFYTSCYDVWHTEPTVKTPGSYYGYGSYSAKPAE